MNIFLLFLVKSTLSLSLLYLAFSVLMRKETFFQLNRMVLLVLVLSSLLIPILSIPQLIHASIPIKIEPIFQASPLVEEPVLTTEFPTILQSALPAPETVQPVPIPIQTIVIFVYFSGVLVSFLMFVYSICSIFLLFRKARKTERGGIRIRIVDHDIPAFSFGRNILVSQHDFDTNYEAIITHEQSHIRLGHFYDLMLMELVKIIFWFNPLVYRMVSDLKAIHEFQADDRTLHSGIDAIQYQILIIKKCVGHQKFALANSFNHCQIKNRITMMNKQKTSKAGLWKVATFLPLLALLLMAFGKTGENVNSEKKLSPQIVSTGGQDSVKKMNKTDVAPQQPTMQNKTNGTPFLPPPIFIEIKNEGVFLMQELVTLDELEKRMPIIVKNNPQSRVQVTATAANGYETNLQAVKNVLKDAGVQKVDIIVPKPLPPNKDKHQIWLKNNGKVSYNEVETQIDELAEKVKSELQKNPKLQFNIMIEEGKIDERVHQIKEILKANGNPKVRFFSFHDENIEKDSIELKSSVLYTKPMDIK